MASKTALIVGLLSFVVIILVKWLQPAYPSISKVEKDYEFIIVGGGTAGCVLAAELSKDPSRTVLLIEAGGPDPLLSRIPLFAPIVSLLGDTWDYTSTKQKHSHQGFNHEQLIIPRGKFLGGTSGMNYHIHNISGLETDPTVSKFLTQSPRSVLQDAFIKAKEEVEDFLHVEPMTNLISNGKRTNALEIFLKPALGRSNLDLMLNAEVTQLKLSETRVSKMLITRNGERFGITAKNSKIILTAGSINTPLLLQKSGIGPKEDLVAAGVSVTSDLPVGMNLADQMIYPLYFNLKSDTPASSINLLTMINPLEWFRYFLFGTGTAATSGIEAFALSEDNETLALLFGVGTPDIHSFTRISNMKETVFNALFPGNSDPHQNGFILLCSCLRPKSRGSVKLGADSKVRIDPGFLEHPDDLDCMRRAVRRAASLGNSKAMKAIGAKIHLPKLPGCLEFMPYHLDNDRYLECLIRSAAMTFHHPTGTAQQGSVLDSEFRVKGFKNLYVSDASVLTMDSVDFLNAKVMKVAKIVAKLLLTTKRSEL